MKRVWAVLGAMAAVGLAGAGAARADSAMSPVLAGMETMVTNLGYVTTEAPNKLSFSIVCKGKYNYPLNFTCAGDGGTMTVYVGLSQMTAAQVAKAPLVQLPAYDYGGDTYFASSPVTGGELLNGEMILAVP